MCGIAGFFGSGDLGLLARMGQALAHRGPDGEGQMLDGPVGLVMRRLAIIDVAGGDQPIANETGRMQIVFNGELYNYKALRAAHLGAHHFRTASDTEVVLHLYEQFGEASFAMLNGMYAFALWDGESQQLYVVRDRLGIKPLYYHRGPSRLSFASELKALLQDADIPRRLDPAALSAYLTWQYVPAPATMIEGVLKLPPGHFMRLKAGAEPLLRAYWTASVPEHKDSRPEDFLGVLHGAVQRQMVSDVPLGAFLSGGVDSSLIVALMRQRTGGSLQTFTAGFSDPLLDESPWATRVARHLGVANEIVRLDESALDAVPELAWHLDEPLADRAALPTLFLSRLAARHVKVVLTGEGSDELFAGYPRYRLEGWARRFHTLPLSERRALWARVLSLLPARLARPAAKLLLSPSDPGERREAWVSNFSREARQALLVSAGPHATPPAPADAGLSAQLLLDMRSWLVDNVLMKADKITMAASLEARVPFLDAEVVDWALALPDRHKLRWGESKHVVKHAAMALLPAAVVHRPKQAFHSPTARWFRTPGGRALLQDSLLGPTARARGLFDPVAVEALLTRHEAGADADQALWNLLILEWWQRAYLDRVPVAAPSL